MSHIRAIVRSRHPATTLALYLAFLLAFSGALALGHWLRVDATGTSYVLFSVGLLVGVIQITETRHWAGLITSAVLLQWAWLLAIDLDHAPLASLLFSALTIALAVFVGSTPAWLLRGERREMRPDEILAGCIVTTVTALLAYALAQRQFFSYGDYGIADTLSAGLSFGLGVAVVTPLVVVLGLTYGRPRGYNLRRVTIITISSVIVLIAGHTALTRTPMAMYQALAPYQYLWLFILLLAGIVLALRASATMTTLVLLILTTLSGITLHSGALAFAPGVSVALTLLLQWQTTLITLIMVLLTITALVAGRRKEKELQWTRDTIASDILVSQSINENGGVSVGEEFLIEALGIAARYCGADECRLYGVDPRSGALTLVCRWQAQPGGEPAPTTQIAATDVPQLADAMQRRRSQLLRADPRRDDEDSHTVMALGIAVPATVLCHPLIAAGSVGGMGCMITFRSAPVAKRDAGPLLQTIGEFYVSFRLRQSAQRSIRSYEQRLRDLAARFVQAEEAVRRRTSVELHDSLIQRLAVARMKLGELRQRRTMSADIVNSVTQIVDESLRESRSIINHLSPSVLYELGLVPGLHTLCDELNEQGSFTIVLREHGRRSSLDEALRVCIYHVVSELIDNSIRHSGGENIWIDIFWEQFSLDAVVVSDDGTRQDWWLQQDSLTPSKSLGLLSASERLRPFGFTLKFERRRGDGTRAIVYWDAASDVKW